MKLHHLIIIASIAVFSSCKSKVTMNKIKAKGTSVKEFAVTYQGDSVTMKGYVDYDTSSDAKRPVILIIHEWWGLTDYPRYRAKQLAELGYVAMAIDLYGNGATADNPTDAQNLAGQFYANPQRAKARFEAALAKIATYAVADTSQIGAIGYCFGGAQVLNMARLGEPLKAVVSFHGNLIGVPVNKDLLKAKILVCHGGDDQFVKKEEVEKFKKQMDSIHADYKVIVYDSATHAFTNPSATRLGNKFTIPIAYNAKADTASWNDMSKFFESVFKVKE